MANNSTPPNDDIRFAELDSGPSKSEAFLDKHFKTLVIGALLLMFVIFGFVTYNWMQEQEQERASEALTSAGDNQELLEVADEHKGTRAAGTALVMVARNHLADGDREQAAELLQRFVDEFPEHSLRGYAMSGLVGLSANGGDSQRAQALLDEMGQLESADAKWLAMVQLSDQQLAEGDVEAAERTLQRLQGEHPQLGLEGKGASSAGPWSALVDQRLRVARAGLPEKVDELEHESLAPPASPSNGLGLPPGLSEQLGVGGQGGTSGPSSAGGLTTEQLMDPETNLSGIRDTLDELGLGQSDQGPADTAGQEGVDEKVNEAGVDERQQGESDVVEQGQDEVQQAAEDAGDVVEQGQDEVQQAAEDAVTTE